VGKRGTATVSREEIHDALFDQMVS
jgi:hypothetical protein